MTLIDAIRRKLRRNDLPPKVRNILTQHGNEIIRSVKVCRKPIEMTNLLNKLTLGLYQKLLSEHYDNLFHLWLEMKSDNYTFIVEKNDVVNIDVNPPNITGKQTQDVLLLENYLTLNDIMNRTRQRMGPNFLTYDAKSNNCQYYVIYMCHACNWRVPYKFVMQNIHEVFKSFPSIFEKLIKLSTKAGAMADVYKYGQGIKYKLNI
jgi:hypothetical protein